MFERLVEKTGPAVQLDAEVQTKGERTKARILDLAYESIIEKGFAGTSIDELVEAAGITKSGFFYHFKDKNDLARQLFERFLVDDFRIVDTLEERARELSDDPLQSLLIFLNLYAQMMDDVVAIHPGCIVASVTYQERLFDHDVRRMNVEYLTRMRDRFCSWLETIAERYPPREEFDPVALADQLTGVVEGAIILAMAFKDDGIKGRQMRLYRQHIKLLFGS